MTQPTPRQIKELRDLTGLSLQQAKHLLVVDRMEQLQDEIADGPVKEMLCLLKENSMGDTGWLMQRHQDDIETAKFAARTEDD